MNPSRIALRLLLLPMLSAARAATAQVPADNTGRERHHT
jgi:hypothetical protein